MERSVEESISPLWERGIGTNLSLFDTFAGFKLIRKKSWKVSLVDYFQGRV